MARVREDLECRISKELQIAIRDMPDLSLVTVRMLKEILAPKFGDEWETISADHKAFIKEKATAFISATQKSRADLKERIGKELQIAIRDMADLSVVTIRMLKEILAPKFGDEWEAISADHKAFIKEKATALITEAQTAHEINSTSKDESKNTPSTVKKSVSKVCKDDNKTTPSTVHKKEKKVDSETTKKKGISSEDESDDFKDRKRSVKEPRRESKGKPDKVKPKEETKSSCSKEAMRLKTLAKQCG
jgi:hypothetical protein